MPGRSFVCSNQFQFCKSRFYQKVCLPSSHQTSKQKKTREWTERWTRDNNEKWCLVNATTIGLIPISHAYTMYIIFAIFRCGWLAIWLILIGDRNSARVIKATEVQLVYKVIDCLIYDIFLYKDKISSSSISTIAQAVNYAMLFWPAAAKLLFNFWFDGQPPVIAIWCMCCIRNTNDIPKIAVLTIWPQSTL